MELTTTKKDSLRKFYDAFIIEPSGHIELKEESKKDYQSFVRKLHQDELPNNWRYEVITDLLQNFCNEYDTENLEDVLPEIVDSLVDIYNYDLIEWLKGDIMRGSFRELRELNIDSPNMTVFDLIRQLQYECIYDMGSMILNEYYF
jgi:hypothetical protein